MMSVEAAKARPLSMAMSGPAGGVAAAAHTSRALGLARALAFDMGGTTTDVCLIADGVPETAGQRKLGDYPARLPMIAVESIGAGGGSIARVEPTGALKVGPRSAGAVPGPACYGRGGAEPPVSDANLLLGYLNAERTYGGSIRLDPARAESVIRPLAARFGFSLIEAAHGVVEVANANMLRALRLVSVQRGYDLRDFALIAYGGAGPVHAGLLARQAGITRVIVPVHSGTFSALGCLVSPLRDDAVQTWRARLDQRGPRAGHRSEAAGARAVGRRREGRGPARLVSRDGRSGASRVSARGPPTGSPGGGTGAHRGRMVDHARLPRTALRDRSVREPRRRDQRMRPAVHPVTLEVVRNALYAIAEEMSVILMRSAHSPLLKEAGDLSSALTDAEGCLIAQGRDIPIHMGVMAFTVKEFLKRIPAGRMRPGDVWFLNLPEVGGNHLPDVKAIRPVFAGDRLVAFAINLAHLADIGGALPGSYVPWATECYQEGVRIPPIRLFSAGRPDREAIDLILANLRGRDEREGDIFAQFAADDVAARRLAELVERYGVETLRACFDALHVESEAQMRAALRALPDGAWEGEDWLDDDGVDARPLRVKVRVEVRGDEATFDFTGTAPQARGPVNTTIFIAHSSVYYAMKALVAPEVPPNDGCYRPLHVWVPSGTLLSADPDRPVVGGNHETSQRVVDAIFRALAPVLPDRVAAGGPTTSGVLIFGARTADGRWAILYEVHGGGEGATAERDGASAIRVHMSNVMDTPTEVIEAEYPVRIEEHALRPGSAGGRTHRGGLGFRRAYRVLAPEATLTSRLDRPGVAPWGVAGGAAAGPLPLTLHPRPEARDFGGKATATLRQGDLLLVA